MADDHSFDSGIAIERHAGPASPAKASNGQRGLNAALSAGLVAIVALAPIPLGSNRPFFWAIWAAVLGVVAIGYLLVLARRGETLRFPLGRLWGPLLLSAALAIFLVILAGSHLVVRD